MHDEKLDSQTSGTQPSIQASDAAGSSGNGFEDYKTKRNPHPELTALKPLGERVDHEAHPSQIIEASSQYNYYKYGWMQEPEPTSAMNIAAFLTLLVLVAATGYLLAGTKLLKFIRFFLTKKQYKKLNISLKPDLQAAETPYETGVAEVTPRSGTASQRPAQTFQLLSSTIDQANRSGLISHLSHHASTLIQFYAPALAAMQVLSCCSSSLTLPRYVIVWQLVMRVSFVMIISAAIALAFLHTHFDEKTRNCFLSHELRASSFFCLNKLDEHNNEAAASYKGSLYALGCLSAFLCASTMLVLSHSIFANFTAYLEQLLSNSAPSVAAKREPEVTLIMCAPEKSQQLVINTEESTLQVPPPLTTTEARRRSISPCKNQKKSKQQALQDQSISSFRALLDRESDTSSIMPLHTNETGYDSGYGHMSMSTSAGLANQSERGGALLNMSQSSAREAHSSQGPAAAVPKRLPGTPDLLPIDEDVDDEKCSPIKPKRRTDEDSPFKKHLARQMSMKESDQMLPGDHQLVISDEDVAGPDGEDAKLVVGGFGIELDRVVNDDEEEEDISSLNLNSGLATPPRRRHSSPNRSAEMKLDDLIENELSAIPCQGEFRIQVEQVEAKAGEQSSGRRHFDGLNTLNSNSRGAEVLSDRNVHQVTSGVLSGNSRKNNNNNMPTIQVNSFSNVDDSTLQLETIGPFKQRVPSSTRNGVPVQQDWQMNHATDHGQNLQMYTQQPLSVREANRPATGVNLGLITPFQAASSNNEVQTDDRNSLGFGQQRNTVEVLSSDQVSKNSVAVRPDACIPTKLVQKRTNEFEIDERLSSPDSTSTKRQKKAIKYAKLGLALFSITALTFCACLDAYYAYTSADEGLAFVLYCLAAALICDLVLQLLVTLTFSAAQLYCEVKNRKPILNTEKLVLLTAQAKEIASQVFSSYEEQAALLKLGYNDEEDQLPEQVEEKDTNSLSSLARNQAVGAREVLVRETINKVTIGGFSIEIQETLKFKPPGGSPSDKSASKINLVQPNGTLKASLDQMTFSSGDEEAQRKRKRWVEVGSFERNQKFFAGQMPIIQKHLRKRQLSNSKKSAKILRQSIDNIELENIEGDFSSCQGQKLGSIKKSQTPEKLKAAARKSSLAGYSSSKKMSHFETPKMSQVKLKIPSVTAQADGVPSDYEPQQTDSVLKDVQRRLTLRRSSNSITDSNHVAGRLDSMKKYAEDDNDVIMHGVVGMILGNSTKSIQGPDVLGSIDESSRKPTAAVRDDDIVYASNNMKGRKDASADKRDVSIELDTVNLQDKYSPVFSSVNRKEVAKYQVTGGSNSNDLPLNDRDIQPVGTSNAPVRASRGRQANTKQPTSPVTLQHALSQVQSNQNDSSSSQMVQAAILSQKEVLSKAQSFNSPKSLKSKLQLTNEKIQSSIEKSSLKHGRRKLVMLDEADASKQSLNFGGAAQTGGALTNNQLSDVFRIHAKSLAGSSGTATPIVNQEASNKTFNEPIDVGVALVALQQQNSQVLFEDQGGDPLSAKDKQSQSLSNGGSAGDYMIQKRDFNGRDGSKLLFSNQKVLAQNKSEDVHQSIVTSAAKRSSIASRMNTVTPGARDSLGALQCSTEKQQSGGKGQTSAFQRLVMASKRMMQKKSSEKKGQAQNRLTCTEAYIQARANSQTATDTAVIMKEQSKAFFSLPFKIGLINRGASKDRDDKKSPKRRSTSDQPQLRNFAEPKPLQKVSSLEQKSGDIPDVMSSGGKIGGHLQNQLAVKESEKISEMLDQESHDVETPIDRPRARDGRIGRDGRVSQNLQQTQNLNPSSNSSQYKVPEFFKKEQVNPVKNLVVTQEENLEVERRSKQPKTAIAAIAVRDSDDQSNTDYLRVGQEKRLNRGFKQRKNSQLTTTKEGNPLMNQRRRNSKNSHNFTKVSGSREKRNGGSSREGTMSNCSIDFDKMDKHRDEDASEYSKLISQASTINRLEDQRRRLESFLSLAQQAKSKRDIDKIQGMIRQIDETGKPLPMSRINELKLLELMASPYNQSLIAMIKVELDIAKKVRDLRKAQHKAENCKSKFSLPKHLNSVASRVINNADSQDNLSQPPCIVGGESDTHLTRVVNIRPKGISSCRSNNDVATRKFQRSPGHFQQQSPLSHGLNQPVLSSKVRADSIEKRDSSATAGRYSYLRSVGNAVVAQEDVRKSVDRIRMGNEIDKHLKSKSDLDILGATKFEEIGRRGTAPTPLQADELARLPKSSLNYQKPELMFANEDPRSGQLTGKQSKCDLLMEQAIVQEQERSYTSYNIPQQQWVGQMMLGDNGFIKRIAVPPMQSKSALAGNKENQIQPKGRR